MNSSSKASFSFFLVFTLLSALCFEIAPAFDHYILATQWAPTFCTPRSKCISNIPTDFVIHGLWPSNNNGYHPEYCNTADVFDYQNVVSLEPQLSNWWPDLLKNHAPHQFLAQQWKKHGTCSGLSQLDYFDKALRVYGTISPLSGVMGIPAPPPNNYQPGIYLYPMNLVNEWQSAYGYFTKITCYYNRILTRVEFIFELHYNVTKDVDPSNGQLQPQSIIDPLNRNIYLLESWHYILPQLMCSCWIVIRVKGRCSRDGGSILVPMEYVLKLAGYRRYEVVAAEQLTVEDLKLLC